ncbi:MAG: hypothetical protein NTX21_07690 [Alphaproteobacteria bacterium]|nr:hypothetical protein [Alphaproteobacteria bacterium]
MGQRGEIARRAHWPVMSAVMDFVPLADLPEAKHLFAHFSPI